MRNLDNIVSLNKSEAINYIKRNEDLILRGVGNDRIAFSDEERPSKVYKYDTKKEQNKTELSLFDTVKYSRFILPVYRTQYSPDIIETTRVYDIDSKAKKEFMKYIVRSEGIIPNDFDEDDIGRTDFKNYVIADYGYGFREYDGDVESLSDIPRV